MAVIKGGFEIVKRAMLKELMKRGDDGIMLTLPKNELVDLNARITMDRLIKAGINPESLTSPDQVLNVLENINNQMMKNARVISADSAEGKTITDKLFGKKGEVVEFPQKRTFKEEIEAMKKSGDIVDKDDMVISEKITDREMFKNSNLNKRDSVTETISYIKTLEPMDAMKEANSVIGRKGKYKNLTPEESKKILQDTEDHIFERDIPIDPEDMAKGGRAGYGLGSFVKGRSAVAVPGSAPVSSGSGNSLGGLLANFVRNNSEIFNKPQKSQNTFVSNTPVSTNVNQSTPAVDSRMNLDYDTLISQNEAQRNLQSQRRNKPIMLKDVNQVGMPREITQDDIDTFNFNMSDPMMTGFDYSKENNWSPGQPAPDGYRVANMLGDTYLERIYPSKEEVAGLPGMIGPMGPMPLGLMMPPSGDYRDLYREDPDAGLSGQEYAEKYGIPYAKGGRAGLYTGGMVDVEPNLSDIGHGSDALMARTRLVSPDGQATTSTGLNYLLAEDNDNIRVPFNEGKTYKQKLEEEIKKRLKYKRQGMEFDKPLGPEGTFNTGNPPKVYELADGGRIGFSKGKLADAARRKFMKAAGAGAAGLAALKTGLVGLGEKAAPVVEKVAETAQGVPPYFYQLIDVIKSKGQEIKSYGDRIKQYIAPSKDGKSELMLTEDLSTGDVQVKKIYKEGDDMVTKSEEMNFTKGRGDESTQGTPADDYEEVTEFNSRIYKDEFNDPDVVEGIDVEEIVKEIDVKKADGGRIGFSKGKLATNAVKFLEKIFGKENMAEMPNRDPEMYQGMLEVVDMFRNRDKEGLKMYMQKFLPHMDDTEIEEFIIGDAVDSAGQAKFGLGDMSGQLIRLGSGRDYAAKIKMIKEAENAKKLENLDVKDRKPNALGGIQTMLGE
jgi:hypothetical protein